MKRIQSRITLFLVLLIILAHITAFSATAAETLLSDKVLYSASFIDVPKDSFYAEPVSWAVEAGITGGTTATTFSPQATCSNAQVITFLWRACGSPGPYFSNPFSDVSEDAYYYEAALWAYECGMADGAEFQPDKPCSRSMAMTYLWKEAGMPKAVNTPKFSDVSNSADYSDAVAWGVEMGITGGTTDTTFSPQNTCTRAQIITFLYRDLMETTNADSGSFEIVI